MILTLFLVFANRHNLLGLRRFAKIQNNVKSAKPRPNGVLQLPLISKQLQKSIFESSLVNRQYESRQHFLQ